MSISRNEISTTNAFTLVELLTVIAIIGILAGILIPVVGKVRATARAAQCLSNVRQLGTAVILFAESNRGRFPNDVDSGKSVWDKEALTILSSASPVPWNAMLHCPADFVERTATNATEPRSYAINPVITNLDGGYDGGGWNPANPGTRGSKATGLPAQLVGNPSRMVLLSEWHVVTNTYRNGSNRSYAGISDTHNGGMNVVFCDGHASRIRKTAELTAPDPKDNARSVYQTTYIRNN
ncbi:prepilin-type N-terminal cleavage/methylation domain-containing protein [Geminisphaera colitermitum]|uniref:prepilin-type N-terminal cleavage/methylation domain-containing protein n=1 Tax=Geminisphaera colitermitum TaxID=1148786 RepID=UPI000158C73D|nr:H-X9-DG-CTERM domain-containing protein [Geminisphaera colitermitum]